MKPPPPAPAPSARAELLIEPPAMTAGREIELSCRLLELAGSSRRLWFRFPESQAPRLTRRADPFVRAILIYAMGRLRAVHVRGAVSPGLFANLADFQNAFTIFHGLPAAPPVEFSADEAAESAPGGRSDGITAFSGGVDSCFSVYRHSSRSDLAPKRPIRAALMMHGFDIPLDDATAFARVAARGAELTREAGLKLFTGATNLRSLPVPWETQFGTAVAASLSFFQPAYAFGLVPSFHDYAHTDLGHGSNPLTDPLLSSPAFQVIHDGTSFGRIDKLALLQGWPSALRHLRVCWQGEHLDRNCCRCEKCIRTILMLRLCGVERPEAFPLAVGPAEIARLVIPNQAGLDEHTYLLAEARRRGLDQPWMHSLARAIKRNARFLRLQRRARALDHPDAPWLRRLLRSIGRRWLQRSSARRPAGVTAAPATPPAAPVRDIARVP